jgi:ACR3 family arsenite efflux pump ArsB
LETGVLGEVSKVEIVWNYHGPRWRGRPESKQVKEQDTDWRKWLMTKRYRPFDPQINCEFRLDKDFSSGIPDQWMSHVVANFVLMPFAAFAITRLFRLDEPLGIALLLLGTASGAPFLPLLARISKGNLALSVGLTVLLMVVTVGYMPVVLPLMLEGVSVDPMKIGRSLVFLMMLPLAVGLLVRARLSGLAAKAQPSLSRLSIVSLALLIALLLITNMQNVVNLYGTRGVFEFSV